MLIKPDVASFNKLGWKDRGIKLAMFEAYVHAVFLFNSPLWGIHLLDPKGRVACNCTGESGAFYSSCTRALLGVSQDTCNSITYVLAVKNPFLVYITKSVRQYAQSW